MKTLTQVVLPLAALAGVVFGVTYLTNYSADRPKDTTSGGPVVKGAEALKFHAMTGQRQADSKSKLWFQRYWQDNFELGEEGHYDFWFSNLNAEPARVAFTTASCTCAGADLGVIPPDDLSSYLCTLTAANWPQSGGPVLAAVNALQLKSAIRWSSLAKDGKRTEGSVPGASAAGPQFGLLRLNWKTREEGERTVSAQFAAQLPGGNPTPLNFEAKFVVVPPFGVYSPSSNGRAVRLGEIGPRGRVGRELYVWSRTRPAMQLTVTPQVRPEESDCVTVGAPVALSPGEVASLTGQEPSATGAACAYRVPVSVQERVETEQDGKKVLRQLDLGPVDFVIKVTTEEGKSIDVPVHGTVRGDIRLVGGAQADRIDFGNSFSSAESRTAHVTLMAESDGAKLELDRDACTPEFLRDQIELKPDTPKDGKTFWTLRLTIPANKLYGELKGGYVVLKAGDRRLRLPIKASTFDGTRF